VIDDKQFSAGVEANKETQVNDMYAGKAMDYYD